MLVDFRIFIGSNQLSKMEPLNDWFLAINKTSMHFQGGPLSRSLLMEFLHNPYKWPKIHGFHWVFLFHPEISGELWASIL